MSVKDKVVGGIAVLKGTAVAAVTAVKKAVAKFDADGQEVVDGRAMEPPIGYEPSKSLSELIAETVRGHQIQAELRAAGHETEEEANDFDVGDDFDPTSPYEAFFEPITEDQVEDLVRRGYVIREEPSAKTAAEPPKEEPKATGAAPGGGEVAKQPGGA